MEGIEFCNVIYVTLTEEVKLVLPADEQVELSDTSEGVVVGNNTFGSIDEQNKDAADR